MATLTDLFQVPLVAQQAGQNILAVIQGAATPPGANPAKEPSPTMKGILRNEGYAPTADGLQQYIEDQRSGGRQENPAWATNRVIRAGKVSPYGEPMVYLGGRERKAKSATDQNAGSPRRADALGEDFGVYEEPVEATLTHAMNRPYQWSEEKILESMRRMREAGINVTDFDTLTQVWGGLVNRAAHIYSLSGGTKKVTPWDVLDMHKSEAADAGTLVDYESGTKTTTQRTVNEITEGQGWQVMQQVLAQQLGRDPSDDEVRDFTFRMNQAAARNPSITETIQRYKAGEIVEADSTTTGGWTGADVARAAEQEAQADPDWAEYQASTTFYNAALGALGAIGDV